MRIGRRKKTGSREQEMTRRTREEARAIARKQRVEARRRLRAQGESLDELRLRARGTALETRRRLRPVFGPVGSALSWIAPKVTGSLMFVVKLLAALIALVAELGQTAIAWIVSRVRGASSATAAWARVNVTPLRTVAAVGIAAAIALIVSQFHDYRGVAVDVQAYSGEVGNVAPAPLTDTQAAGSAHLWVMIPLALAAIALIVATLRGRPRLAVAVAACGALGLAVTVAIDLPQGLDAGTAGLAFSDSEAQLLEGFWAEAFASGTLVLCGGLLALYSRGVTTEERRRDRTPSARSGRSRRGVAPRLQADS